MGKLATIGLSPRRARDWAPSRATETALGSATETLFGALPERERAALADLPMVVSRLEREAIAAREHLDRGDDGRWAERLERSVAAIETLRVGLLRMAAGHAEGGSLTVDLDAARQLAERIDYLMAGVDEVDAMLSPSDERGHHHTTQPLPSKRAPSTSLG